MTKTTKKTERATCLSERRAAEEALAERAVNMVPDFGKRVRGGKDPTRWLAIWILARAPDTRLNQRAIAIATGWPRATVAYALSHMPEAWSDARAAGAKVLKDRWDSKGKPLTTEEVDAAYAALVR